MDLSGRGGWPKSGGATIIWGLLILTWGQPCIGGHFVWQPCIGGQDTTLCGVFARPCNYIIQVPVPKGKELSEITLILPPTSLNFLRNPTWSCLSKCSVLYLTKTLFADIWKKGQSGDKCCGSFSRAKCRCSFFPVFKSYVGQMVS